MTILQLFERNLLAGPGIGTSILLKSFTKSVQQFGSPCLRPSSISQHFKHLLLPSVDSRLFNNFGRHYWIFFKEFLGEWRYPLEAKLRRIRLA